MSQMSQTKAKSKLHSVDPVWSRIREEAEDIARDDPSLGGFIFAYHPQSRQF